MIIRHITTTRRIEHALRTGELGAPSLADEGFVHCCTEEQLDGVLRRFHDGDDDVSVVSIDTDRLRAELRWEAPAHPDGSPTTAAEAETR